MLKLATYKQIGPASLHNWNEGVLIYSRICLHLRMNFQIVSFVRVKGDLFNQLIKQGTKVTFFEKCSII